MPDCGSGVVACSSCLLYRSLLGCHQAGDPLIPLSKSPEPPLSSATYYAWKAKFGGLEVSDAKRLRALEEENARLKRLLADTMLDNAGLKDLLSKKW